MSNKEIYRQYCQTSSLPIYLYGDWLDVATVQIGTWDVVISYDSKGDIRGFWPYVVKKQLFWKKITMPPYTPYMGPRVIYPEGQNEYERISWENEVLEDLIHQLPDFDDIQFKWERNYVNWLPFYWKSFKQETRYTYIIQPSFENATVSDGYKSSVLRQIRKAEKCLTIRTAQNMDEIIRVYSSSMSKQSHLILPEVLRALDVVAQKHDKRWILEAVNEQGVVAAAIYILKSPEEWLYLYGGYDEQFRDSGAMHLLFDHVIIQAMLQGVDFNFEGSMLPGVEKFFRSFGCHLTPVSFIKRSKFPYQFIQSL